MDSKIKNIIIFTVIAASLILIYIFFIKPAPAQQNLVSSGASIPSSGTSTSDQSSLITSNFLSLLLSVKGIKLNDTIFSDDTFLNLKDSSILLIPPGNEGRSNPFAPIGFDIVVTPPPQAPTPPAASPPAPVKTDKTIPPIN